MSQTKTKSLTRTSKSARTQDAAARKQAYKTEDSFQNFAASLGIGTQNITTASTYGFNPITRLRTILEWIHRGSWIGGVAVDVVADDMTRAGADILGEMEPEQIQSLERAAVTWNVWNAVNDVVKWSRLYGGCIGVILIDGQNPATPLRLDRVTKGQFRGVLPLDRWMIEPDLTRLVKELGPDLGLPEFYNVTADAPALMRMKIHYSRCLRMEGTRLPYWQRIQENLWGLSVYERIYDRMVAFDSATQGAAQLVYKSYLRTYKLKGMRAAIGQGGVAERNIVKMVDFMRRMQSIEGITLLDGEDDFQAQQISAFGGLSDALINFGQQLSGALQIPLVRLFGQSPAGLNSTGESDLRTYYDNINNQQNARLLVPLTKIFRAMAAGEGIPVSDDFALKFRSLWLLSDQEKSQIATQDASTISTAFGQGVITRATALKELKQSSQVTGRFTNITDDEIAEAEQEPTPFEQQQEAAEFDRQQQEQQMELQQRSQEHNEEQAELMNQDDDDGEPQSKGKKAKKKSKGKDAMLGDKVVKGFNVVIEQVAGEERYGSRLPSDYGYIRQTDSAERGDQMDCFVSGSDSKNENSPIFIVDQYRLDGTFDEHKIIFGVRDSGAALALWRRYYKFMPTPNLVGIVSAAVSQGELQKFLSGDVTKPYTTPTEVNYGDSSDPAKMCCGICKYYLNGVCLNRKVQFDPKVPEGWMGSKNVGVSTSCEEFEKR